MIYLLKQLINPNKFQSSIYTSEKRSIIEDIEVPVNTLRKEWAVKTFENRLHLFEERLQAEEYSKEEFFKYINIESNQKFKNYIKEKFNLDMLRDGINLYKEIQLNLKEPSLEEFVYPFVLYAMQQFDQDLKEVIKNTNYFDWQNARQALANALTAELVNFVLRTVTLELQIEKLQENLEGDTSQDRFEFFITQRVRNTDCLSSFYEEYPLMTRICLARTNYFISNVVALFTRIRDNWKEIQQVFKLDDAKLIDIEMGLGDTHGKGQTVAKLNFSNRKSVMYKPKPLDIVQKYNQLLLWINHRNTGINLPLYNVLDCKNYGFEQYIEQKPCNSENEVKDYYTRFGQLVGLIYMISGADMHYENIIAHGNTPYLIDLETIFHQYPKLDFPETAEVKLKYMQSESVLGTGLLPQSLFQNADGKGLDLSAVNGDSQKIPFPVLQLDQGNTDEMSFKMQEALIAEARNKPYFNNQAVDATAYLSQIIDGFEKMMLFFLQNKEALIEGPIQNFADSKIRIILRGTQHYSNFLNEATHPDYSSKAVHLEEAFERMWLYPFKDRRVIFHELQDLLQRDIPYFYTTVNSKNLYTSQHKEISNFFEKSGLDLVIEKISKLTKKEIHEQKRWLILSFGTEEYQVVESENSSQLPSSFGTNKNSLKDFACQIGDYLIEEATWSNNQETISWMTLQNHRDKWNVLPMSICLYDGLAGMALFFLELYNETKIEKYKLTAQAALESAFQTFKQPQGLISAFFGEGSLLYALHRMQTIDPSAKYQEQIEKIQYKLLKEIKSDRELDFLGGSAGIICLATSLYKETKEKIYMDIIKLYSNHLLANAKQENGKRIWINRHVNKALGGLSHGAAGIALALNTAGKILNDHTLIEASHEAFAFESKLFESNKGWKDLRDEEAKYMHHWTHGTVGNGLSYLLTNAENNEYFIRNSLSLLMKYGSEQKNTLNNGVLGQTELFLLANQYFKDNQFEKQARNLANKSIESIINQSKFGVETILDFEAKGLFNGIAGTGYQLLRIHNPQNVPSILTLGLADTLE